MHLNISLHKGLGYIYYQLLQGREWDIFSVYHCKTHICVLYLIVEFLPHLCKCKSNDAPHRRPPW